MALLAARRQGAFSYEIRDVNGWPAIIATGDGQPVWVIAIECDGEQVQAMYVVSNPDKLGALAATR